MKPSFAKTTFFFSLFFLTACSSNLMVKSDAEYVAVPDQTHATIVFIRSSFVASAIGVELFEISNGELEFVGSLPNGSKIAHETLPGEKVYMAYGTAADFMIAKVEGGKVYYSIVRPNWGTGGFAPTPVRKAAVSDYNMHIEEFNGWVNDTTLLDKKAEAATWFESNKGKYQKIYETYWQRFQTKSDQEKNDRTLYPSDGVE